MGETTSNATTMMVVSGAFLIWAIVMTVLYAQEKGKVSESSKAETGLMPDMVGMEDVISSASEDAVATSDGNDYVENPYTHDYTTELISMLSASTTLAGENTCAGAKLDFPNIECFDALDDEGGNVTEGSDMLVPQVGPQAGTNVTKGYNGDMPMDGVVPITEPLHTKGLCPVNVHWHLGTEHFSAGEYDCEDDEKCGPEGGIHRKRKLAGKVRQGYQCNHYDPEDEKFTKHYEWKFCDKSMQVGQTYEVHWPHSTVGACGTPNQYQTPFYDGVFCNLPMDAFMTLSAQDIASNVGVQGQIFTIVNDEDYYYPNMIDGMIVNGDFGLDMAIYTGSTTGTTRNNEMCSQYTPITWQVDRKCHMISASSFDKMCADMLSQRDNMEDDLHAHGSRELVLDVLAADNHMNLRG